MEVSFLGKKLKLDSERDGDEIASAINSCKGMETLTLQGNTLGVEASKVIAHALKQQCHFKNALWSDMYTGRLRSEIPQSLELLSEGIMTAGAKLSILDLSDNAFGPDGVDGIKKLLRSESCYLLHTLKLNNNGLGIGGGKILSEAFIDCHKSSSSVGTPFALKVFISGRNRLENEGAEALSEAFKLLGSLEEITMPQNGIRPEGVTILCEAFKENKNLKVININDNTCTLSGAASLAECLPLLTKLEVLDVGDCLLENKGAKVLAPSIAASGFLKTINLSFNEIKQDGALAVVNSIRNKNHLQLLNLDGNELESVDEIQEQMSEFNMLDSLGPFDDNEEPDSDEDEEDQVEDDDVGEVEEDDEKKANIDDLALQITGIALDNQSPLLKDQITNFTDDS